MRTFERRSGKNLTVFYNVRAAQGVSLDFAEALKWVFMVPKRTGTAVTRNRIRRQIREIARLWIGRKNLSGEIMVRYESAGRQTSGRQGPPTQVEVKEELLGILAKILSETCEN
ncbi:MAG: ribonuclease P protein component [candidate division Zixibacteria bacterium]|nr:ribonuclease P protein component [candidate division Zixibacteria bacterium]